MGSVFAISSTGERYGPFYSYSEARDLIVSQWPDAIIGDAEGEWQIRVCTKDAIADPELA